MQSIWEADKLALFIAFIIPGFIMLKVYSQLVPGTSATSSKQLVDALAYSCINYALLAYPIWIVEAAGLSSTWPNTYAFFYVFALLIAPILWATAFVFARNTKWAMKVLPHPTDKPWDFVFRQRKPYWVIVTLSNGEKVAGKYGPDSFSSSAPSEEQIFLEEVWELNSEGGFERPRTDTAGALVISKDISSVELFEMTFGGNHDRQEGPAR